MQATSVRLVTEETLAARAYITQAALDAAMEQIEELFKPRGEGYVNVLNHGAKRDNVTDSLDGFHAAIDQAIIEGHCRVYAPGGIGAYRVRSAILQPDYVELFGDGIDITTIKLLDSAPRETHVITNKTWEAGNRNLRVQKMTLDWNQARQGGLLPAGGARSSCLAYGQVRDSVVREVKSINAGLHGFDVTWGELDYPYLGDGVRATKRSVGVHFYECEAYNFGDDAFTAHSSDDVTWSRCYGHSPRNRTNNNAFEADGDCGKITMNSNRSMGCYAGVEIKGHGSESATDDVIINGHRDIGSVRSYNWRHIGYHSGNNPVSKSAKNIIATNLVSVNPNNDKGFQDEATARALCISAYQGVTVNGMTIIGRGGYGAGDVAVAVQFRAGDVNLVGLNIRGWDGADQDLSVTSGDNVNVSALTVRDSSKRAVYVGATVTGFNLAGLQATAGAGGGTTGVDIYTSTGVEATGLSVKGYAVPVRADSVDYPSVAAFYRRTRTVPVNVVRLADLDPTQDYYASTTTFAAFTDAPTDQGGGNFISHSRMNGDSCVQTVTRASQGSTLQRQAWRVLNWATKTAGPWNSVRVETSPASDVPAGTTRLVDLDPARDYYAPTATFEALTDRPTTQFGGNLISHSRMNGDSCVQTVTRFTQGSTLQTQNWRIINFAAKTAGPWNPTILPILAAGATPSADTPAGTVFLQRTV